MSDFPVPTVALIDNRPATTSLAIAEHFGKQHKNILRDIEALIAECPEDFARLNFEPSSYTNEQNKQQPMYHVFFDGFMLLVMGYTGKKALQMKLAYIAAFNAMKEKLEGKLPLTPRPTPSEALSGLTEPAPDTFLIYYNQDTPVRGVIHEGQFWFLLYDMQRGIGKHILRYSNHDGEEIYKCPDRKISFYHRPNMKFLREDAVIPYLKLTEPGNEAFIGWFSQTLLPALHERYGIAMPLAATKKEPVANVPDRHSFLESLSKATDQLHEVGFKFSFWQGSVLRDTPLASRDTAQYQNVAELIQSAITNIGAALQSTRIAFRLLAD